MKELKLKMELVPSSAFSKNLRNDIGQTKWDKIRKKVYERQGKKCAVCDASGGRLLCHEIWDYKMDTKVQKLVGFKAVCVLCNLVIHNGFANTQAWVNKEDVVHHFLNVNNCTMEDWEQHRKEAFERWGEMSKHIWTLNYDGYESLV